MITTSTFQCKTERFGWLHIKVKIDAPLNFFLYKEPHWLEKGVSDVIRASEPKLQETETQNG